MNVNHQRKTIRLDRKLYQEKGQPFSITICTHNNIPLLREFEGLIFQEVMEGSLGKKSDLMATCVMPDHIHLLLAPISENLIDLIGKWKSYTTHLMWKKGYKGKVWQRSFYDHALRKDEDLIKIAEYIVCNPVRKALVKEWRNYSYSWHKWMENGRPQGAAPTAIKFK
jgi:putative transposase